MEDYRPFNGSIFKAWLAGWALILLSPIKTPVVLVQMTYDSLSPEEKAQLANDRRRSK